MKRYTKFNSLFSCQLNRDDVVKIFELIRGDNMPTMQEEHIEVSSKISDMRLSSDSISEFITHPELPDALNDITYEMIIWNDEGKIKKSVLLSMTKDDVFLRVDGNEPVWVNGKFAQIVDFLHQKKSWYSFLKNIFQKVFLLIPIGTIWAMWSFIQQNKVFKTFIAFVFLIFFFADIYYYKKGILFPSVDINLNSKFKIFDNQTLLVVVTLITATILALVSLLF